MRIFYCLSGYISHRLAGLEYVSCLRALGHEVCCNYPEQAVSGEETIVSPSSLAFVRDAERESFARRADLVILHEEPCLYKDLYAYLPYLRQKSVVAYLPWENEDLPEALRLPLELVGQIWTCSEFSRQALSRHFAKVEVLPHVVRRPKVPLSALNWAKDLLRGQTGSTLFLSVMDGINPRKNLQGLLAAFNLFRRTSARPARLLIKQYRAALSLENHPDIINITETLEEGRLAALYALCDAYVSPHRAEGWGLSLSTAMAFGRVVIATEYSGNLEFMNRHNSLLVPYRLEPVSADMVKKSPVFNQEMRWAEVDLPALVLAMRLVAEGGVPAALGLEAARITGIFGPDQIGARLRELLEKVTVYNGSP